MVMQGENTTMQRTKRTSNANPNATPGFAIEIRPDTNLGLAILVAEDEEGHYEPVGVVVSINEAREIAAGDMRRRHNELARGEAPMCPYEYKVWAQGLGGDYRVAGTIPAINL
jgi:hypothetical protein